MQPLSAGQRIGRYRIVRRLGVGSYGEVWLAQRPGHPDRAIKTTPLRDPADARLFRLEFEKLRPLQLPHVVRVYETGVDDGCAWFTMDIAEGLPLHTWVQAGADLHEKVDRLCLAGAQVARGLAAIHRVGLAHRDLKPANIHVDEEGRVTILDFGTARFGATRESSSAMMGTIPYMAPEQRVGLPHDLRVDTYALGATLHESLSGIPAGQWRPGRPRPPLARLGAAVPLPLSWLVDRLLSLDPVARPTADNVATLLHAISDRVPLAPVMWPSPPEHAGDTTRLMSGGPYAVVGPLGSGRKRFLQEARWQWYRRGYRSLAARCVPDRPYAAIRDLLTELFRSTVSTAHSDIAGVDAAVLQAVWPGLPVEVSRSSSWPPAPQAVGQALARLFGRYGPLAVALVDVDEADVGTASVLPELLAQLPDNVRLWATSRRPVAGFRQIRPPPWSPAAEREVLPGILPAGEWPGGPPGRTPLESCARAWRTLARWRNQPGPAELEPGDPTSTDLQSLAVLDEPFPVAVANELVSDVHRLLREGHLSPAAPPGDQATPPTKPTAAPAEEPTESTDLFLRSVVLPESIEDPNSLETVHWLRFSDPATRLLARATGPSISDREHKVEQAWSNVPRDAVPEPIRALAVARHAARGRNPHPNVFAAAARVALERGEPSEVDRWLQLYALHGGDPNTWGPRYARVSADLDLDPTRVHREAIRELGRIAPTDTDRARAALLLLRFELRRGDVRAARQQGTAWADGLAERSPALSGQMRHEVAVAALTEGDFEAALAEGGRALAIARTTSTNHLDPTPSLAEIDATCTLARIHLDRGARHEALALAEPLLQRCAATGRTRGEARLAVLLSEVALLAGHHALARDHLARVRTARRRHPDPSVLARAAVIEAQLAVEQGDPTAATVLIAEGRGISAGHGRRRARRDLATLTLELAVHTANTDLARHARIERATAASKAPGDHWATTLARWRWLTGDLAGALEATTRHQPRGLPLITALAERSRLLLVAGRYPDARTTAREAARLAEVAGLETVVVFARLVEGAAGAWSDKRYLPVLSATRRARWVHLYLGGLHLDAIRRQLRGDDARATLTDLHSRARAIDHQLYTALSRTDAW